MASSSHDERPAQARAMSDAVARRGGSRCARKRGRDSTIRSNSSGVNWNEMQRSPAA